MKTYKATDNTQPSGFSLHAIEPEFAHMLPAGCVEITEAEAEEIRAANMPQQTHAELQENAKKWARQMRLQIFTVLDGLQVSAVVNNDMTTAQAIETGKQALRDITATVDLSTLTTAEDMQNAFILAYWEIRETVPASVQSAFNALVP